MLGVYLIMKIFDYEDIQLIPNKCIVNSRSECDTTVKFGPKSFKLPVVPANMQTVMNETLAEWFAENDYFYIMHRFDEEARIPFVKKMHNKGLFASISVGIKEREFDFVEKLAHDNVIPEYITIDIAHGHSDAVINMIKHIKSTYLKHLLSLVTLVLRKAYVNWKMLVQTQLRLVLDQVVFVLQKLKQVLAQVVGN